MQGISLRPHVDDDPRLNDSDINRWARIAEGMFVDTQKAEQPATQSGGNS